ncbi:hypothetical protein ACFVUN_35855 [Kitasatospora griseola]|uniref:hypothetical protein n=1 Tax=Kitasatospora griseola TaxID=2064 RepID=UPI0036DB6BB5
MTAPLGPFTAPYRADRGGDRITEEIAGVSTAELADQAARSAYVAALLAVRSTGDTRRADYLAESAALARAAEVLALAARSAPAPDKS